MYLNFKQRQYLRRTRGKGIIYTEPTYDPIADYLSENGLVRIVSFDREDDYYKQIVISEQGKAYLSEHFFSTIRANIALGLSILSLVISVLTFLFK